MTYDYGTPSPKRVNSCHYKKLYLSHASLKTCARNCIQIKFGNQTFTLQDQQSTSDKVSCLENKIEQEILEWCMNNKYHAELHLACTPCWIKSCSSGFFCCSSIHYKSLQNFFSTNLIQQRLPERLYAPYTISNDTNIQQNEYKFDMEQKYI